MNKRADKVCMQALPAEKEITENNLPVGLLLQKLGFYAVVVWM